MRALPDITAVILAGGLGMRLRPVVADLPKVLAPINGRPFLTYLLDQLAGYHLHQVVLCTGYQGAQVHNFFGDSYNCLRLSYSHESEPRGTGGALQQAHTQFESDTILALNGDSYCDSDLNAFFRAHDQRAAVSSVLLAWQKDTARFGQIHIDSQSRIKHFAEKGPEALPGWINAGIYLLPAGLIASLPEGRKLSLERDVFPTWVGRGLFGHPTHDAFLDIGTPESYAAADAFFAARRCT